MKVSWEQGNVSEWGSTFVHPQYFTKILNLLLKLRDSLKTYFKVLVQFSLTKSSDLVECLKND